MQIFNLGNHLVNRYLVISNSHRLLIDSGYPESLFELGKLLRPTNFKIQDIDFLICTHFHIDHAGAAQELKNQGVKLIVFEHQTNAIKELEEFAHKKFNFTPIKQDNLLLQVDQSEAFFQSINLQGKVIITNGHSKDSVSVIFKSGEVFTGDLYPENSIDYLDELSLNSWKIIKENNGKIVYPGHGDVYIL